MSVSSTTVTVTIPALPPGQYDVSVFTGTATSNFLPFFYIAIPQVTALSSNRGSSTPIRISLFGSSLATTQSVEFVGVGPGTDVRVISDTIVTVLTPQNGQHPDGCTFPSEVRVTSLGGVSPVQGGPTQYVFYEEPAVTAVVPNAAVVGSLITVTGTCLLDAVSVVFELENDGIQVPADFTQISATVLTTTVPPTLAPGTYDIKVTTPGGQSDPAPLAVFTVPPL
ncbi:hypothetical protein HCK00_06635 [Streptomyces sp. PLAI1-29]|uniref:IPT/TIG domain-containing protein n=1 Tax=Streptomyces zingiberis TaxID=2053010 RepID=A0ABX1BWG2_9ACTN|nr:hypothetical protein [Streptomyces zingiberis]